MVLGNFRGSVSAGLDGFILGEGNLTASLTAGRDAYVWTLGNVLGSYQAGQDVAAVAYGSMDAKVAAGRDVGYVWARGNLTGVISAGRNIGRFDGNYYYHPYDYDVFSYGSISAVIVAPSTSGGKIGSVGAWYGIAGCVRAATSINTVHAGGAITATIVAPQIGSVVQNDASLRTSHPYPSTPESIKDAVLAEGAAVYGEVLADRALVGAEIEAALAEIAAERVRAFGKLAETRAEVDAGIAAAKARSQQRLQAARAAAIQGFQDMADAAHREMDLLEGLTEQDREELKAIVAKIRAEDKAVYDAAVAEQAALAPKLEELDHRMRDLKQKDSENADFEAQVRGQCWDRYALAILGRIEGFRSSGAFMDPQWFHAPTRWDLYWRYLEGPWSNPHPVDNWDRALIGVKWFGFGCEVVSVVADLGPLAIRGIRGGLSLGRAAWARGAKLLATGRAARAAGFGANGLYRAPLGMADEAVRARYLAEVGTVGFRVKLFLHNILTPGRRWVTSSMIREQVASAAFGRGAFTVSRLSGGRLWFGGSPVRTFLNRQKFHHELIHVSQIIKNPNLWSRFPWRMAHEVMPLLTAHGALTWPLIGGGTWYFICWWNE